MGKIIEIIPELFSLNDESVEIVKLFFNNGDFIEKDAVIVSIETSKSVVEMQAPESGFIKYLYSPGDSAPVNSPIALMAANADDLNTNQAPVVTENPGHGIVGETVFSDKALELLAKLNLNPENFTHKSFVRSTDIVGKESTGGETSAPAISDELVSIVPLPTDKKREIEYLAKVQGNCLTSELSIDVDFTAAQLISGIDGIKYFPNTLLPVVLFETAKLLGEFNYLNAFYHNGNAFIYKDINLGFAIDADKGLRVLKIPATEKLSLSQIDDAIFQLTEKYLTDKLEMPDVSAVTFTVTDLSYYNVAHFSPLVNAMNSAILGISSISTVNNSARLTLTFDHRLVNGKYVAIFLNRLKERVESYRSSYGGFVRCSKCNIKLTKENSDYITMLKTVDYLGKEKYICHTCYEKY